LGSKSGGDAIIGAGWRQAVTLAGLGRPGYAPRMILETVRDLPEDVPFLGLDLGEKTIGVAVSDPAGQVASALETVRRSKFTKDAERLEALIAERRVGGIVLGLPVNMDGSEGPRSQSTRQFARNLVEIRNWTIPIAFWDERLSTTAVERVLIDQADMTRSRRGQVVDKMAAAFILQGALDARRLARGRG
jgi:putative Holliday junction resolvase